MDLSHLANKGHFVPCYCKGIISKICKKKWFRLFLFEGLSQTNRKPCWLFIDRVFWLRVLKNSSYSRAFVKLTIMSSIVSGVITLLIESLFTCLKMYFHYWSLNIDNLNDTIQLCVGYFSLFNVTDCNKRRIIFLSMIQIDFFGILFTM